MAADENQIDYAHFRSFTLGDEDLEKELVDLFETNVERYLSDLKAVAGRAEDWYSAAHRLKGAARGVGAYPFATLAEKAENLTDHHAQLDMLTDLKYAAERAVTALKAAVNENRAIYED